MMKISRAMQVIDAASSPGSKVKEALSLARALGKALEIKNFVCKRLKKKVPSFLTHHSLEVTL